MENPLEKRLQKREEEGNLRQLTTLEDRVDFTSNDYLGLARESKGKRTTGRTGSGGSRLLIGNSSYAETLEKKIAAFHKAEAGLIFNSGYDANIGLLSCVPVRGDVILYDALVHASIRDGIRLSTARNFSFRHNDQEHLLQRLKMAKMHLGAEGRIYVVVESVYSMDGDEAPLKEICTLSQKYNAAVIVDEAHAVGLFGAEGEGSVVAFGLQEQIFARVVTFGKALGCHGAIVLGSQVLRNYLINFSRPFIFTTALPETALIPVEKAYKKLAESILNRIKTSALVDLFKELTSEITPSAQQGGNAPIQVIKIPGNENAKEAAEGLQKDGYDVRAILHPTVPEGSERLRIVIHAFNTEEEIKGLVGSLKKWVP